MLELQNICVFYGSVSVIRKLNLKLSEKEVVIITGRNGAGKTTIMRSILGQVHVKSGRILYKGENITNQPSYKIARKGIGYCPEDRRIFPDLTAEENMEIGAIIQGLNKNEIGMRKNLAFEIFPELKKLMHRKGKFLSGGEQKMLSIARAFLIRPSIILLDEPLEGLAPIVVKRFIDGFNSIKEQKISMIIAESTFYYISQLINSKLADKLFVLERGEKIYEGAPEGILEDKKCLRIIRGY